MRSAASVALAASSGVLGGRYLLLLSEYPTFLCVLVIPAAYVNLLPAARLLLERMLADYDKN
jgi:hypothetical protein